MENNGREVIRRGVTGRLVQSLPQAQLLSPLGLSVNTFKSMHHVRTIPSPGVLLAAAGVDAVLSEEGGKLQFPADPFGSAVGHINGPCPAGWRP